MSLDAFVSASPHIFQKHCTSDLAPTAWWPRHPVDVYLHAILSVLLSCKSVLAHVDLHYCPHTILHWGWLMALSTGSTGPITHDSTTSITFHVWKAKPTWKWKTYILGCLHSFRHGSYATFSCVHKSWNSWKTLTSPLSPAPWDPEPIFPLPLICTAGTSPHSSSFCYDDNET